MDAMDRGSLPHATKESANIEIERIKETWGRIEQNIQEGTQTGALNAELFKIRQEAPLYKWGETSANNQKFYYKTTHKRM